MIPRRRPFGAVYAAWTLFCAALFVALAALPDPARPEGRILSIEASAAALRAARAHDPARFGDYEVVHVARARRGEGAAVERWIVLLDRQPRTFLRHAVVVEVSMDDGRLLRIREPERK